MTDETVLSVDNVSKRYGEGTTEVYALTDATISIKSGEMVGIVGPSGSGKTTFLLIAGLLDTPTSGAVSFRGQTISRADTRPNTLRDFRRQHVGFVFQKPNLIPFLTAAQNVQIALAVNGAAGKAAKDRSIALLQHFGVDHRANNFPNQLSGGEQQRVAIARALANTPRLLLADEPTASLDSERGRQVMGMFRELADREGVAVCVVTHDPRTHEHFDRIVEIQDGRVTPGAAGPARRPAERTGAFPSE
jgi:putative ABC transport system ATP-binding protein